MSDERTETIILTVNGEARTVTPDSGMRRLLDVLRMDLGLTGAKEGCGEGECGACSVLLDGRLVNSCLIPVAQAAGSEVLTPEGLAETPGGRLLAECYAECHGAQCGFCTPGMMMASYSLLMTNPAPDEQAVREGLSGNICRCTGYDYIIDAVLMAAEKGKGHMDSRMRTFRPATLAEALEIRAAEKALPLAGGTDLMVRFRAKNGLLPTVPGPVMFTDGIRELRGAEITGSALVLGASLPMAVLADDPGCRIAWEGNPDDNPVMEESLESIPDVLRDAAASLGAPGLRQRAVLAGNVANASPAGDTVAALYALDAAVVLESVRGRRVEPIGDFITGPSRTVLADDELITALRLPAAPVDWCLWRKVGTRKANALTKVSVAAAARIEKAPGDDRYRIASFALAFGAVGPTVVRVHEAEAMVRGAAAGEFNPAAVLEVISPHIKPIDDQRSTAEYRKTVAMNLAGEALSSLAAALDDQ